tara:strand:+ start:1347 stop:2693 length:1347 start_codon:yes stop_codon:yes gene_type:complete
MIPNVGKLLLQQSRYDAQQNEKNRWRKRRLIARDYYNGETKPYTEDYFSVSLLNKVPIANVNITKRIIDRISLVYMKPPKREYSNENFPNLLHGKDFKLQRAERMTNLLEHILIKPTYRNGVIEHDIIMDFEAQFFDDDPLRPSSITYPLAIKASVLDDTPELYAYWDAENTFVYDVDGKIQDDPDNPDHINPYGVLPFVECFRNGRPEYSYIDTSPAMDILATNLEVNVSETNSNANTMFQSFGYMYVNGSQIEKDTLEVGQDKISFLGIDGTMNIVSPPNTVEALANSIEHSYKLLAQNYNLNIAFVEGSTAMSGVALKLRNTELQDARISDVIRWKQVEQKLFNLESIILGVEANINAGELLKVDYEESMEILSDEEQRAKWDWELANGLIDRADILMQRDPDRFPDRESAQDYLFERSEQDIDETDEDEQPQDSLLQALTRPVE